jgi:hypothetical protein
MMMKALRWSDNDKYFGPFTYAPSDYDRWAFMLGSGDDEYPHCRIRVSALKRTLICRLPAILKPYKEWVDTTGQSWNKDKEGPQGFWDIHEREYGFTYSDKALHLHFGPQTHDSRTTKSKCYFLPWLNWRHVRTSHYDTNGNLYYTEPKLKDPLGNNNSWRERQDIIDACPTVSFLFKDYDGQEITAKTTIQEREWHFGEGKFKWLSWFNKPMIRRSLDLRFSAEVGPEKGSWKGGTIGHSIDMESGELHEEAFKRYCENEHRSRGRKYKIEYVGKAA